MNRYRKASTLAAGSVLLALGLGAASARADTYIYNYYSYTDPGAPTTYQYVQPPVYSAPLYSTPPSTTYYYSPNTSIYVPPSSSYYDSTTPPGYVPPGLSITSPLGTYAPLYGGFSSYGSTDPYDSYRTTPGN